MEQQSKPILICTVGLPRSGKSTWAKSKGFPIVSPDAIRLAMTGEAFNKHTEHMVWAVAQYMVRALFHAGHSAVIIDATNTTRGRRQMWYGGYGCSDWDTKFKLFDTSIDVCNQRAIDTNQSYLLPVIEKMNNEFTCLDDAETAMIYHG